MLPQVLTRGFYTGLILQFAPGPVLFFLTAITLERGLTEGLMAALAVTIVDFTYIVLALKGTVSVFKNRYIQKISGAAGAFIIAAFGVFMIFKTVTLLKNTDIQPAGDFRNIPAFMAALIITGTSPVTALFWTGVFSSRASAKGYSKRELYIFGTGAGLATPVFLGTAVSLIFLFRLSIPSNAAAVLNGAIGFILFVYGISGLFRTFKKSPSQED